MRIGRRVMKALFWGLVLCLSILGGGLWFAYWYMTDGETVAQLIREHAVRYFPGSTLDPGRVQIQPVRRRGGVPPAQADPENRWRVRLRCCRFPG